MLVMHCLLPSCLGAVADALIVHPNVVKGAMLHWPRQNMLYVEGHALDEFSAGKIGLRPKCKGGNRIGLLLDSAIERDLQLRHLQVANAARATLGVDIAHCVVTSRPLGIGVDLSESGASWGRVDDTDALLEGAAALVERGCEAIAVVGRFPEGATNVGNIQSNPTPTR
jgi:hypothetical protein